MGSGSREMTFRYDFNALVAITSPPTALITNARARSSSSLMVVPLASGVVVLTINEVHRLDAPVLAYREIHLRTFQAHGGGSRRMSIKFSCLQPGFYSYQVRLPHQRDDQSVRPFWGSSRSSIRHMSTGVCRENQNKRALRAAVAIDMNGRKVTMRECVGFRRWQQPKVKRPGSETVDTVSCRRDYRCCHSQGTRTGRRCVKLRPDGMVKVLDFRPSRRRRPRARRSRRYSDDSARRGLPLRAEAGQAVGVGCERRWRILMATWTLQLRIAGAIHLAHTPGPKGGKDFVRAKACAGVEGQTAGTSIGQGGASTALLLSGAVYSPETIC